MPRVQEYLPENEAQGPVGQTSPMLEQIGMFGRGIEEFGNSVTEAGSILHQRQTQAETSDAYASVAEQRANMAARIQQETADGTLDIGKVQTDYQDWAEKQYDTYDTTSGKDAFARASSRAGGSLLQTASRGYAIIQGNKAKDNLTTLMNSNSSMVMNDPSQFPDLHSAQVEAVQSQVDSGAISQPDAERMKQLMNLELAKGAIRGYMQSDYASIKGAVVSTGGKVDPNEDQLNTARKMLDHGAFDEFLDTDQKAALQKEIRSNQTAAQTAGVQAIQQRRDAVSAQGEQFKMQSFEQLQTNGLNPDDVTKAARAGLITSDEQLKMYHLIDQAGKEESVSNPVVKNGIMARVLSPDNDPQHISDPLQVAYLVKDGMLSKKDFQEIQTAVQMVPSNRVNSFNEGKLLEKAKNTIGTNDPQGEYKLAQFTSEVQQAKQKALNEKQPIGPLMDPSSPTYLGNQISKYVATPQDILRKQADQARGITVAPANIATAPGVNPTPPSAQTSHENINSMDLAGLSTLNPKSLSPSEKAVAAARWRELKQGSK